MKQRIPDAVLRAPHHSLVLVPVDPAVHFYIRENDFTLASYPPRCTLEFALPIWDDRQVICVALLVRLAGRNASTFERWLNPGDPGGLRILQLLSGQANLDVVLISDRSRRSFRRRNTLAGRAAGLVASLRVRPSWTPEEFDCRRRRLDTLYPTSAALWRGAKLLKK
jgi:hypothetical protein